MGIDQKHILINAYSFINENNEKYSYAYMPHLSFEKPMNKELIINFCYSDLILKT